jgi:hypothetical protein
MHTDKFTFLASYRHVCKMAQVLGGVVYPTNLRKNAKYTIHVVDNSQYHMNTLTIIQGLH